MTECLTDGLTDGLLWTFYAMLPTANVLPDSSVGNYCGMRVGQDDDVASHANACQDRLAREWSNNGLFSEAWQAPAPAEG